MLQSMMLPVPPAEQPGRETGQAWETANARESATAFQRMEGVFPCLRFCLRMSASMTVNIVLTGEVTMWYGLPLRLMRSVRLPWSFTGGTTLRAYF